MTGALLIPLDIDIIAHQHPSRFAGGDKHRLAVDQRLIAVLSSENGERGGGEHTD